jgi:DNA-binding transcriptional LysR family regulator
MKSLQDLALFVATAEAGSLSAAARRLGLTPAAASAALKRLEADLSTLLFVRSTRHLRLTAEGERFLRYARRALQLLDDGREAVARGRGAPGGVLQISAPSDLGRRHLLAWLDEFQARHPGLGLRLQLSDRLARLHGEPVDVALRYGKPRDSGLVALPIAPYNRRILCASPDYVARFGAPRSPSDLAHHPCLCFVLGDGLHERWRFARGDEELTVTVRGDRRADDGDVVRRWAVAGHGIAYKSGLDVAQDLRAGLLLPLCSDWQGEAAPFYMVCADRRQLSPAVKRLRQLLVERCAALAGQEGAN